MSKLYTLLGTKDVKEQERRVEQLLKIAQNPVTDIVIRSDTRLPAGVSITVIGYDQFPISEVYVILDKARDYLKEQEVLARLTQPAQPAPDDPGVPAPPEALPPLEI